MANQKNDRFYGFYHKLLFLDFALKLVMGLI